MIQLQCFHFSILLFGWSNKKFHCHHFWATFVIFNFVGTNLKIEIRGQFVNFKKIEGSICNFLKFFGVKIKILENLGTKMQSLKKYNNEEF